MAAYDEPRFLLAGDRCLVVEFGDDIDEAVNARVRTLAALLSAAAHPAIVEAVPTYRSLMVHLDPRRGAVRDLEGAIRALDAKRSHVVLPPASVVSIPCTYGGEFGPDLPDVAAYGGVTEQEVVAIHSEGEYLVHMMGFTPGFPYLGGLSPRIATPRLATPRTRVPAGSVGIAARQTGIYPTDSPGGWRIIGRTPVRLFDATRDPPVWCDAGDYVRFVPIDPVEYDRIRRRVEAGSFVPDIRRRM
ncbi:MAG: 5-oxoprolinase subunit PxpB [Acidobacteriota bacterium]